MVHGKHTMRPKRHDSRTYRSGLEVTFNKILQEQGFNLGYEISVLAFTSPAQKRRYTPDWTIKEGWYIETKGLLDAEGRKKLILIKEQHPSIRILIVFQRHQSKLYKNSPTTYGQWCTKQGIEWCGFEEKEKWLNFIKEAQGSST